MEKLAKLETRLGYLRIFLHDAALMVRFGSDGKPTKSSEQIWDQFLGADREYLKLLKRKNAKQPIKALIS